GAVFFETAGWERPNWYASNKLLLEEYGERVMPRRYEWDARWWSPIINAEHLAMRDRVGMVDLSAFAVFDIAGSCALDYLQKMCVVQMNLPVGRVIYTSLLNSAGGIKADLTVMRLGVNHFRVVTGGADGMRDRKWFSDHLPEDPCPLRAGCAPMGFDLAGGPALSDRAGRNRCIRHNRPPREVLPRLRQRTGAGVQPGGDGAGPASGEVTGLHRKGGVPQATG